MVAADRPVLRIRWLGRVAYDDALALQRRLHSHSADDHLLLLEHPHVVTLGRRGRREHLLVDVEALGGSVVETDRGGEVTYHGPGQLVGYPILTVPGRRGGGMADTAAYVGGVEQLLIDVLADLGPGGRTPRPPHRGVGRARRASGPERSRPSACGCRGRAPCTASPSTSIPTWAGSARIVPCGITGLGVTSLAAEGIDVSMREVVDLVAQRAAAVWGSHGRIDRADVAHRVAPADMAQFTREAANGSADADDGRTAALSAGNGDGTSPRLLGRLAQARLQGGDATGGVPYRSRKPEWMRVPLSTGPTFHEVRSTLRGLDLVTVCEEAGCPNISECWNDGTATFMILGERCTRACGFCLVDTRRPGPVDQRSRSGWLRPPSGWASSTWW